MPAGTYLQVESAMLGRLVLCPEQRMRNLHMRTRLLEAMNPPSTKHSSDDDLHLAGAALHRR
jgi:hypothetical protein